MSAKENLRTGEIGRERSFGVKRMRVGADNSLLFRAPELQGSPGLILARIFHELPATAGRKVISTVSRQQFMKHPG